MKAHEQDDKAHLNKAVDTVIKFKNDNEMLTAWRNKNIFGKGESMMLY